MFVVIFAHSGFFSFGMHTDHTRERRDVARRVSTKPLHISENHFQISITVQFYLLTRGLIPLLLPASAMGHAQLLIMFA
jgi:hypothetical protein